MVSEVHSGHPNYKGRNVELGSTFNLPRWEQKLNAYKYREVVNLLQYGLPLGIENRSSLYRQFIDNHPSAVQFHKDVGKCIKKELTLGALTGPFEYPLHPSFH